MKRCPQCNRTYADETMAFCLADGALLSAPLEPHATYRLPGPKNTNEAPTEVFPGDFNSSKSRGQDRPKSFYVAVALVAVLLVGAILLFVVKTQNSNFPQMAAASSPTVVATPSPSPSLNPAISSTPKTEAVPSPSFENKPDFAYLSGTYSLYPLENPSSDPVGRITITIRAGNKLFVRGSDWKGSGVMTDEKQGYYDWEFEDGKHGRTTVLINPDGSLQGKVFGSGLDWWYLARRQK